MMPQMQQIRTKYICEQLKCKSLKKQVNWLFGALLTVAVLCMIGLFIVIQAYETKANLGNAVLNSGICVESDRGFVCNTPDNLTFIEK